MKQYLVHMRIGKAKYKWFVYAETSSEAIKKALWEVNQEMEQFKEEVIALMVKEIKE